MFSGIVEEMGSVSSLIKNDAIELWDGKVGEGVELTVKAKVVLDGATNGCSICVNGVCLTVVSFDDEEFKVGLAPETLRQSNLEGLVEGDRVNLERALAVNGRNSGHFVQGHVDDVGTIVSMESDENSIVVKIKAPEELMRYIVPKGFIALDGTSLTVCEVDNRECTFTVMLVAYTQDHIVLPSNREGDKVNLEVDVLGKYVERSFSVFLDRLGALEQWQEEMDSQLKVTKASIPRNMGDKLERLDHLIKNRDLVLDLVENRLARLESQSKKE